MLPTAASARPTIERTSSSSSATARAAVGVGVVDLGLREERTLAGRAGEVLIGEAHHVDAVEREPPRLVGRADEHPGAERPRKGHVIGGPGDEPVVLRRGHRDLGVVPDAPGGELFFDRVAEGRQVGLGCDLVQGTEIVEEALNLSGSQLLGAWPALGLVLRVEVGAEHPARPFGPFGPSPARPGDVGGQRLDVLGQ